MVKSKLNVVLAERRMSKKELCKATGFSKSSVYRWTTDEGIENATLLTLGTLATSLNCSITDLFEEA